MPVRARESVEIALFNTRGFIKKQPVRTRKEARQVALTEIDQHTGMDLDSDKH